MQPDSSIAPFVNKIFLLETSAAEEEEHQLAFYADGFPGIMYSETAAPIRLLPHDKALTSFFLYGQTIVPIKLCITGAYKIVVFQLYPFATRHLIGVDPRNLNDECYDLHQVREIDTAELAAQLPKVETQEQIKLITDYILELVKRTANNLDVQITYAVSSILKHKGNIPIQRLREQLFITERTFERRFANAIGVSPKQFARIVQFNFSLNQLQEEDYTKMTNVAYDNGFTDQSHFIRTFRKFTSKTPKAFLRDI